MQNFFLRPEAIATLIEPEAVVI